MRRNMRGEDIGSAALPMRVSRIECSFFSYDILYLPPCLGVVKVW